MLWRQNHVLKIFITVDVLFRCLERGVVFVDDSTVAHVAVVIVGVPITGRQGVTGATEYFILVDLGPVRQDIPPTAQVFTVAV